MTEPVPAREHVGAESKMTARDELAVVCRDLVELVTDFLDGMLETPMAAAVERHLALCPPCVRYVTQMRATARLLGHLPVETLSDRAKADIFAAFHDFLPALRTSRRNARTG